MTRNLVQFRILCRQFLFRMVDLDALSASAQGDISKLLGQFVALLIFISIPLTLVGGAAAGIAKGTPAQLVAAWSAEHFLIATTMLVVGLFAVLSWESTFPDRRDVALLATLPIRTRTIFLAKVASVAGALGVTVCALHSVCGLFTPFALTTQRAATYAPAITFDHAVPTVEAAAMSSVLRRDLDQQLRSGWLSPARGGGLAIGVSIHGQRSVFAYGSAQADSLFEIGSVTKTFTGLLLSQMLEEGTVRYDTPVRELLPPDLVKRPVRTEDIRLIDLITHRSGLPTDAPNLHGPSAHDPFGGYTKKDLYSFIGERGAAKWPNAPFQYSNVGVALLGNALADRLGMSYEDVVRTRITGPLGMSHTFLHVPQDLRGAIVPGYASPLVRTAPWDLDGYAPAGGIHSTAGDMLTYLEANLHPRTSAMAASHKLRNKVNATWSIALAWLYDAQTQVYSHEGATAGYTASAFFSPEDGYAAVVLLNSGPDLFGLSAALSQHVRARIKGEPAISLDETVEPARSGGIVDAVRLLFAYWLTMLAAAVFTYCCVLCLQGITALLLSRQQFLRVSSFLQMAVFVGIVCIYFLGPKIIAPGQFAAWNDHAYVDFSPSYWFLGMFQQLNGSPVMTSLAGRAWTGLGILFYITAGIYSMSYRRTMRLIVESPDILPGTVFRVWLPRFGNSCATAICQFSIRTLMRSRQHRLLMAFYCGIGFAGAILFTKFSGETNAPGISAGLATTLLVSGLTILGVRVAFALPVQLPANWTFRMLLNQDGLPLLATRRRNLYALSVVPVWVGSAILLFWLMPWREAAEHLGVLALLSSILVQAALSGPQRIPFACSYLPGKSNFNITFLMCSSLIITGIVKAIQVEQWAFEDSLRYTTLCLSLAAIATVFWSWNRVKVQAKDAELQFEAEADPAVRALDLHRDGTSLV